MKTNNAVWNTYGRAGENNAALLFLLYHFIGEVMSDTEVASSIAFVISK